MSDVDFVAVDWGTSSFRLWSMTGEGDVVESLQGDMGMSTLNPEDFKTVLEDSLKKISVGPNVPVFICGMAGSAQGWCEAPYLTAPTPLSELGDNAVKVGGISRDVRILPGVQQLDPANVMRGEETQLLGLLRHYPDFDGVVALPGTHTKWCHVSNGELISFATCMTGEMFALLSKSSVLSHSMTTDGWDDAAFLEAVQHALSDPSSLAAEWFSLRSDKLLHDLQSGTARARLSGWLIGLELAATQNFWKNDNVHLIGNEALCARYKTALSSEGITCYIENNELMTLEGLTASFTHLREANQ